MSFVSIANEADLPEGKLLSCATRHGRIALARVQGQIYAFQDLCTHDDGPLVGGELHDHCIECPRHGARFDIRTGAVLQMPATEDIEVYPVRVTDGRIEVDLT